MEMYAKEAGCTAWRLYLWMRTEPVQNAYIESFKGKFIDKCLNGGWIAGSQRSEEKISRH